MCHSGGPLVPLAGQSSEAFILLPCNKAWGNSYRIAGQTLLCLHNVVAYHPSVPLRTARGVGNPVSLMAGTSPTS